MLAQLTGDIDFATSFFRDYVHGQQAPDFEALLNRAGFAVVKARPGQTTFGWVQLDYGEGGATLLSPTVVGTPLYDAGIDRGDRILQLAGRPLRDAGDLRAVMSAHAPGDTVEIVFEQRGSVRRESLTLIENRWLRIVPYEAVNRPLTDEMRRLRAAWLGSRVE